MKAVLLIGSLFASGAAAAQSYAPAAGLPGSTAVFKDSPQIVSWANGIEVQRGLINIANPNATAGGSNYATTGLEEDAVGYANGDIVSLGDGGHAIATFFLPIVNGPGFDFAVFENGSTAFLELAFVEVSSDGVNYFRFPSHSQTQTQTQIGSFGTPQAEYLNNLAGKYSAQYGTPFDLSDLPDNELLDKNSITHVKIVDVVGSIDPDYATYDSFGNAVNEAFPTPFASGGFDLQAVAVINQQVLSTNNLDIDKVYIYPNPAANNVFINSDAAVKVIVYDMAGRAILYKNNVFKTTAIDVSQLQAGTYTVVIATGNHTKTMPLIIGSK